jgi:putative endopeptidase
MPRRLALLVLGCMSAACSQPPGPAATPPPPPLVSGLEASGFDTSVRPQDDLFRFVNGGWLARTEIPADKPAYGGFYEAFDRSQEQLKVLVEAAAAGQHAAGSDNQKIGDFYTAFMDESRAEQLGLQPLAPELKAIQALSTKADLARYFAHQAKFSIGGTPLGAGVDGDAKDPTRNTLYIGQGGIGLPDRDYYLKDDPKLKEYRTKYVAYITTVLTAAQLPDPAKAAADILAFETRLARAQWTNVESRDALKTTTRWRSPTCPRSSPGSTGRRGPASWASPPPRPWSSRSRAS